MQQQERIRAGRYYLDQRGARGTWQICWYDSSTRQIRRESTGTRDPGEAQRALEARAGGPPGADWSDPRLAVVLDLYWRLHASEIPSAHVAEATARDALEIWGKDARISELTRARQRELVEELRKRQFSDATIQARLCRIWAAMRWVREDHQEMRVPERISPKDWPGKRPVLRSRTRTYTLADLAWLLDVAAPYEHEWRFLVLAIGTASREAALRELMWDEQTHPDEGVLHLRHPDRPETSKRRPTLPLALTLRAELQSWDRAGDGHVIVRGGVMLPDRLFYDAISLRAGLGRGGASIIRHTMRTMMARAGVATDQADIWVGHRPAGSTTGQRHYIHLEPSYLAEPCDYTEQVFQQLRPLLTVRPLKH